MCACSCVCVRVCACVCVCPCEADAVAALIADFSLSLIGIRASTNSSNTEVPPLAYAAALSADEGEAAATVQRMERDFSAVCLLQASALVDDGARAMVSHMPFYLSAGAGPSLAFLRAGRLVC